MTTEEPRFVRGLSRWMKGNGSASDIVISSRVRLARNLENIPFPPAMERSDAEKVLAAAEEASGRLQESLEREYHYYPLREMSELHQWVLVEKHLISPQLTKSSALSGVIISEDEAVSIMVNEEDHFRIQCLLPGLNIRGVWETADAVDDVLGETVRYGFDGSLGYLTTCPTNLGTGMRVSVMVHLPGLAMAEQLDSVISGLAKVGAVVRGLYGEGSEAQGNLFQISNRTTLGNDEDGIVEDMSAVVREVVQRERSTRETLYRRGRTSLEDKIYRAHGLLTNARMISSEEAMHLLSMLRLGIDMNILPHIAPEVFQELMIRMRPSIIQRETGEALKPEERDVRRATLMRKRIAGQ